MNVRQTFIPQIPNSLFCRGVVFVEVSFADPTVPVATSDPGRACSTSSSNLCAYVSS